MRRWRVLIASSAALVTLTLGCSSTPDPSRPTPAASPEDVWRVHLLVSGDRSEARELERAARLAARQAGEVAGRRVEVVAGSPTSDLPGLAAHLEVIGAVTAGASEAITSSQDLIDSKSFPVIEVVDDLYPFGALTGSIFQSSIPHEWQAFRLARYFGPDRRYSKVALAREPGAAGEAARAALQGALSLRKLGFIDAAGSPDQVIAKLSAERPEAVVVQGDRGFIEQMTARLGAEPNRYRGRSGIRDGWRPQIAGFDALLHADVTVPPGTVAVSDYARAADPRTHVEPVKSFRRAFGKDPSDQSARVFDAVRALLQALDRAGSRDHARILSELETFDRVRFGHLPISLGPTDHVLSERDVLGLWTFEPGGEPGDGPGVETRSSTGGWTQLMRTFTSDLERTNILEEDWPFFFDGTTPGGEAPFYHQAKLGSTAPPSDDLH